MRTELWSLRGTNAQAVIKRLNPIIRGRAAYYRTQVSSEVFNALDGYLWRLTYKWAIISHANKPKRRVVHRYFGRFNRSRRDRWVFGDRQSGAYMPKFRLDQDRPTPDRQGRGVSGRPLAEYWAWRRRKTPLPTNNTSLRLLEAQDGRCPICRGTLFAVDDRPQIPREWERWPATTRATTTIVATWKDGTSGTAEPRLIHAHRRTRHHAGNDKGPALQDAYEPHGACLSRMRGNVHVRF